MEDERFFRAIVEVELLKAGIPWVVLQEADETTILNYWSVIQAQQELEANAIAEAKVGM